MARQFSTGTKFGSEKGKVQKPARIPPQTPPAGGKKVEAGQFHSPRKIACPAESKLIFRIFVKKSSNINQKTPPSFTFSENIKKARAKLGLTQDDLAKKADIKYTTLTKVESGAVNKPSVQTMAKIAKALGVSIEELLK